MSEKTEKTKKTNRTVGIENDLLPTWDLIPNKGEVFNEVLRFIKELPDIKDASYEIRKLTKKMANRKQ